MKIALFSTNDKNGGAAAAAYRLYKALSEINNVKYFVKEKIIKDKNIVKLDYNNSALAGKDIQNFINQNRTALTNTLFSFTNRYTNLPNLCSFDIINLHWIEYFLNLENFKELMEFKKPIVWTLHDIKPFSGGCHYPNICEGYKEDCSFCMQAKGTSLPQKVLEAKKRVFENANLTIITPSKWLANEAKNSTLFGSRRIEVIPNGVDTKIFKPINGAKEKLNIPKDTIVLSFGVQNFNERRKGFFELQKALKIVSKQLKNKQVTGLLFGKNTSKLPIPTKELGYINNEAQLALVYSASDMFILPTLEDNLPNIILEAMSCATPVISFDTGGAKDIIDTSNGDIIPKGDIQALAYKILEYIHNDNIRENKSKNARKKIIENFTLTHQAKRYKDLFYSLENRPFKYKSINFLPKKFMQNEIDKILNNTNYQNNFIFSQNFNSFFIQLLNISKNYKNIILYGNGTISKAIQKLMPNNIIGYVDINDKNNHPSTLKKREFDKVLITVLGREEKIIQYLADELKINIEDILVLRI